MSLGTISNASATGAVAATGYGGGLAGESQGSIANSSAAVTVTGLTTTSSSMGGLVGWNNGGGTIQDSYATGNVTAGTGGTRAGGLTGQNNGAHTQEPRHRSGQRRQPGSRRSGRLQQH